MGAQVSFFFECAPSSAPGSMVQPLGEETDRLPAGGGRLRGQQGLRGRLPHPRRPGAVWLRCPGNCSWI